MVKAAKDRSRDNLAEPLDRPPARRILGDGQMCPYPVVVGSISRENPAQMALARETVKGLKANRLAAIARGEKQIDWGQATVDAMRRTTPEEKAQNEAWAKEKVKT